MSVGAILGSVLQSALAATNPPSKFKQFQQEFQQLSKDLQSGNLLICPELSWDSAIGPSFQHPASRAACHGRLRGWRRKGCEFDSSRLLASCWLHKSYRNPIAEAGQGAPRSGL